MLVAAFFTVKGALFRFGLARPGSASSSAIIFAGGIGHIRALHESGRGDRQKFALNLPPSAPRMPDRTA
jgi:hypothetical protein